MANLARTKELLRIGHPLELEFIETDFENASPVWYEVTTDGVVDVHLHSDNERNASNRASGHSSG
jgi:hypothetical protein